MNLVDKLLAQNADVVIGAPLSDAGGADAGVRLAVERGLVLGPRLQVSLDMLSQTGGHGDEYFPCGLCVPLFSPVYPGKPSPIVDGPDETLDFKIPGLKAGPHQVTVRATDARGNQTMQSIPVTVDAAATKPATDK